MRTSSHNDFSVYEFGEAEEAVESAAERFTGKHRYQRNSKTEESSVTKDHFLECFSQKSDLQQTGTAVFVRIDSVASDGDTKCGSFTCNNHDSYPVGTSGRSFATEDASSMLGDILLTTSKDCNETVHRNQVNFELLTGCLRADSHTMGVLSLGMPSMDGRQLKPPSPELPSHENLVDVSEDEVSLDESSISISGSDIHEDEGVLGPSASDHCSHGYSEMYDTSLVVVVAPAYVQYGDRLCTEPVLTFSSDCIKFVLDANGNGEHISFEWAIADIISIKCHWARSVAIACLRIDLSPTPGVEAESVRGTSGPVKLEFVVDDQQWFEKQQRIMSLSARYSAIWKFASDDERSGEHDDYSGLTAMFVSKQCITWEDEPFEDVIYPKGDPDAVSISKRDVELLKPETFINDTIIDFYIKYLKDLIQPENKNRFYFFNSFFFRKLADLDKNPGSAFESKAAFQRVRKWTRKVNIFEKDYIFIPVNFNLHWSLIVICHPGEAAYFKDAEMGEVHKVPCILHMDSIKGSHYGVKDLVQSYLWEEWKERHKEENESFQDVSMKFSNLRFVPLEVPQQENLYDCGLFLLQYVELFLKEAPMSFSPFKITKFSNFLNKDWFVPSEASAKRFHIQKLILGLHDEHSQTIPPAACGDLQLCSDSDKVAAEFVSEAYGSPKACPNSSPCPTTNQGIEVKLLATSALGSNQDYKETGLVYRDFFESGATVATSSDGKFKPFHKTLSLQQLKCTMTPIVEEAENCDLGTPYSAFGETTCQPSSRIIGEICAAMDSPKEFNRFDMFCLPQISMKTREHEDMDSSMSSDPLSCGSQHSSQDCVHEHLPAHQSVEVAGSDPPGETNKLSSVSSENCECVTRSRSVSNGLENCVVEDSQEDDTMAESKESGDSFFSCQDNLAALESGDLPSKSAHSADDDVVPKKQQWGHKRLKLMATDAERPHTRSVSKGQNF